MAKEIGQQSPQSPLEEAARDLVRVLREGGHEAFFAGGSVRDRLLGRAPPDIDIATSATPEAMRRIFPRTIPVGVQFGILVVVHRGHRFEVATFRKDGPYADGRRPESVTWCDAREDALRRDFTINGMFFDPLRGQVVDYVGGREDLARGVVRAIGDPEARFREDRLRLLRAPRFAARLAFSIDEATAAAIRRNAGAIVSVSPERIRDELSKVLIHPSRRSGIALVRDLGLLGPILPELESAAGAPRPTPREPEGTVFSHTLLALDSLPQAPTDALAFATLLHEVGAPAACDILARLRSPNALAARAGWLIATLPALSGLDRAREPEVRRLLREPGFGEAHALHRADCQALGGDHPSLVWIERKLASLAGMEGGLDRALHPPRLLSGDDLRALGLPPGPKFKEMLEAVEDAQLEGRLSSRDDAIALLRARFPGLLA